MNREDRESLLSYLTQMTTSWEKRLIEIRAEIKSMDKTLSLIAKLLKENK